MVIIADTKIMSHMRSGYRKMAAAVSSIDRRNAMENILLGCAVLYATGYFIRSIK